MSDQFATGVTYTVVDCATTGCHVAFAITVSYEERKRKDHKNFYCPNGHANVYKSKTAVEQARDEATAKATRLQAQLDQAKAEQRNLKRQRASLKGQLTKSKKRAANGVCPCCKRTFAKLARHMKGQHPEYVEQANKEA